MLSRSLTLVRANMRLYSADAAPLVLMMIMPLGFMAFMIPVNKALLEAQGHRGMSGAEQVLPGMLVMFAFFLLGIVGDQFFREHGWGTWERLRIAADVPEIMIGKILPALVVLAGQLVVVFGAGWLLFGLDVRGPILAVVLLLAAFAVLLIAMLMALVSWCRTFAQMNVVNNLFVMIFSGLGGAFAPVALMPGWVKAAAPFTPAYWVIEGLRDVILHGDGVAHAANMSGMVVLFAAGFAALAALRFRVTDARVSG